MNNYSTPKVTIDLEEYKTLLNNQIQKEYDIKFYLPTIGVIDNTFVLRFTTPRGISDIGEIRFYKEEDKAFFIKNLNLIVTKKHD